MAPSLGELDIDHPPLSALSPAIEPAIHAEHNRQDVDPDYALRILTKQHPAASARCVANRQPDAARKKQRGVRRQASRGSACASSGRSSRPPGAARQLNACRSVAATPLSSAIEGRWSETARLLLRTVRMGVRSVPRLQRGPCGEPASFARRARSGVSGRGLSQRVSSAQSRVEVTLWEGSVSADHFDRRSRAGRWARASARDMQAVEADRLCGSGGGRELDPESEPDGETVTSN
jgi:hypothetical protein